MQKNSSKSLLCRWGTTLVKGLFMALLALCSAEAADSKPPGKMTFQGFLTDAGSPPMPLGNSAAVNKEVTFKIYDNAIEGNVKWAENQIVTVDKGHFSVLLGEGSAVSGLPHASELSDVFIGADASDRWLGITVDGAEITPRIQFFAAPYAQLARVANSANSLTSPAGANVVNISGDFVGVGTASPSTLLQVGEGVNAGWGGLKINTGWIDGDQAVARPLDVQVRGDSKLVVTGQGNVGIGTGNPATRLHVAGNGGVLNLEGTDHTFIQWYPDGLSAGRKGWMGWGGGDDNTFRIHNEIDGGHIAFTTKGAGNVGIGKADPQSLLDIGPGPSWRPLTVRGNGGTDAVVLGNNSGKATIAGHSGALNAWADLIINPGGGSVGIGTSSPEAPLHVNGAANRASTLGYYLDGFGVGNWGGNNHPGLWLSAIFSHGLRAGSGYFLTSDSRIKQIARRASGHDSLAAIRQLQVTDYTYIDKIGVSDREHRGLVAQELEKVLPEVVSQGTEFVPDIYARATAVHFDAAKQKLTIELDDSHGLKVDDRVSLIMEPDGKVEAVVSGVPTSKSFVVKSEKGSKRVFVFGKQVKDFRTVDYDQVFSTGISALQELDRQVQVLKQSEARIAELEKKAAAFAGLEQKASRVDSLEREVAELKSLVRQLALDRNGKFETADLAFTPAR